MKSSPTLNTCYAEWITGAPAVRRRLPEMAPEF